MDHWERQRLREIERMLESDDPELAERLTTAPTRTTDSRIRQRSNELMMAGGCVTLLGLLVHPLLLVAGLSLMLTGFWIRAGMTAQNRHAAERGNEPGDDDHDDNSNGRPPGPLL